MQLDDVENVTCSYLIATEGSYSLPTVEFPTGGGDDRF